MERADAEQLLRNTGVEKFKLDGTIRRKYKALLGLVNAGVAEDASQRSFPATVAVVRALSEAAQE